MISTRPAGLVGEGTTGVPGRVAVMVRVSVAVPVDVIVGVTVAVPVIEGVKVTVGVSVTVAVFDAVRVWVGVGDGPMVGVSVAVGVFVCVLVDVAVGELLGVFVSVPVAVAVSVVVGVLVGGAVPTAICPLDGSQVSGLRSATPVQHFGGRAELERAGAVGDAVEVNGVERAAAADRGDAREGDGHPSRHGRIVDVDHWRAAGADHASLPARSRPPSGTLTIDES